nr:hypothetical protein [Tanacetum cinerariifolium]
MGQDRQMQMIGGNGGNQFRQYAGQNAGNLNGYNAAQNVGNQLGKMKIRYDVITTGELVIMLETAQPGQGEGMLPDLDVIEEVNANCILMANLQQASSSGIQTNSTPVYDSDRSAEVLENYDNNEIFNMFTQDEQYTELLEPIPKAHQVPQNDNDVISEVTRVEKGEETVEQHPVNFEETCALYESLYQNLEVEVQKVNSVNRKLKETNADLTTGIARYKNQERCFEISQEKYDKLKRNCTARPRRRDAAYLQTQLLIAQREEAGIQLQAEEYDLMAAVADLDEIEKVNANCILMANLQQASSSGTQTDSTPVYDSDGSAEQASSSGTQTDSTPVYDSDGSTEVQENYDDNEIFNMFTQEEQYTELLEPIPEP